MIWIVGSACLLVGIAIGFGIHAVPEEVLWPQPLDAETRRAVAERLGHIEKGEVA